MSTLDVNCSAVEAAAARLGSEELSRGPGASVTDLLGTSGIEMAHAVQ